jgi:hypothetical protein
MTSRKSTRCSCLLVALIVLQSVWVPAASAADALRQAGDATATLISSPAAQIDAPAPITDTLPLTPTAPLTATLPPPRGISAGRAG